jgi:hypothetical protein
MAPAWARERWPAYRALCEKLRAPAVASDAELVRLGVWFLLAWLDPLLLAEPKGAALEHAALAGELGEPQRAALLALHAETLERVVPAYAALAARGQVEITCSPAFHPILPLLIDVRAGRRSRPDLPAPSEPFEASEDARWQVERGLARAEATFGRRPSGMWPSEGGVSPEAAAIVASCGVRWIATDERVLWSSLPAGVRREELYQPWRFASGAGEVAILFRDHELSDRIGFVYSTWKPADAVADFLRHVRRIGEAHVAAMRPGRAVVTVILDGENCWEQYAEDGQPFLEALYAALEAAPDIRTVTPSELLGEGAPSGRLERLHSGSWIDADFHIWVGHPEENRAWDLLARTRRALLAGGATRESHPAAWDALGAAEGSDWFWWFGEDHYTADKALFDSLFRAHLQAAHERAGLPVPGWAALPVSRAGGPGVTSTEPTAFVRPVIDGRVTRYYEWSGAGHWRLGGGTTMHRVSEPLASALHYGFDEHALYLRVDFTAAELPGDDAALIIEVVSPSPRRLRLEGLGPGRRAIVQEGEPGSMPPQPGVSSGHAVIDDVLEVEIPFEALGSTRGQPLELLLHIERAGERLESLPPGQVLHLHRPGSDWEGRHWSA